MQSTSMEPTAFEQRMATEKMRSLLLKQSIPSIIGMLVNALYNVVDRFWVGKIPGIGASALTGLGLCMPVMNILLGFSMLLGIGAASTISIRLGQKDHEGAQHILGNTLALVGVLGICITAIGQIFAEPILTAAGADDKMMPYALTYYRIIMGGYIFSMASFAMNHPIRAAGNAKRFASSQLVGGIANMILDPIFIFVFDMGIAGAAVATILSQFLSACWVFAYYFGGKSLLKLERRYMRLDRKIVLAIFSIGISPCLMQVAGSAVGMVANHSLKFYGDLAISDGNIAIGAMTVISSVSTLFFMPVFGINQGTQPIVGYNYGARDYQRVREAYKWSVIYAVIVCTVGFIVIQLFSAQMVGAFNDDPELIAVGSFGMRIFMSCIILTGMQVPSINFFQAIGRAKISLFLSLLRQVIFLIPAYLLLPKFFGLTGIWLAGPLSDAVSFFITAYFIFTELKYLGNR